MIEHIIFVQLLKWIILNSLSHTHLNEWRSFESKGSVQLNTFLTYHYSGISLKQTTHSSAINQEQWAATKLKGIWFVVLTVFKNDIYSIYSAYMWQKQCPYLFSETTLDNTLWTVFIGTISSIQSNEDIFHGEMLLLNVLNVITNCSEMKFNLSPLHWCGGRKLNNKYVKTWANKTKTVCMNRYR